MFQSLLIASKLVCASWGRECTVQYGTVQYTHALTDRRSNVNQRYQLCCNLDRTLYHQMSGYYTLKSLQHCTCVNNFNTNLIILYIYIIIIIINIKDWTLWSVPSPKLQLLSPTFFWSSNCSLEVGYHQTYSARDWLSILITPYPNHNLQREHRTVHLYNGTNMYKYFNTYIR
jgi:hypothetical protein